MNTNLPPEQLYASILNRNEYERYINIFTKLNMEFVQTVIAGAETGSLGELYELYEYIEASDLRLRGMIGNRRKALTKNPWVLTAGDSKNEESKKVKDFVSSVIQKLKWKSFITDLMDGRLNGVSVIQKKWELKDGKAVVTSLKKIDSRKYEQINVYNAEAQGFKFGEITIGRFLFGTDRVSVEKLVNENIAMLAVDRDTKGKYDLQGVMRGVLRWYLIKVLAVQFWSLYAEKYGFPISIASVSEEDFKKNGPLLVNLLASVGSNKYGVLLNSMKYEILNNGSSAANVDIFDKLIHLSNTEIAIGLLGQNLTSEVSGGSLAASKVHLEVLDTLVVDDSEWADEIINDQFINPLVKVNFPDLPFELYPTYSTSFPKKLDESKVRALREASRFIPIPEDYIYNELGIPTPEDDERVIGGRNQQGLIDEIELS